MYEVIFMAELPVPNLQISLHPGDIVKLQRFSSELWVVNYGWFSFGGNKPMNGWYLVSKTHNTRIKPINLSDLDDIYQVDLTGCRCSNNINATSSG